MISIDKMDAFELVAKALEKNDMRTVSSIMNIITKSINEDKKNNNFSQTIVITNKKDEKLIKKLLDSRKN